jgi:hypothetical protein
MNLHLGIFHCMYLSTRLHPRTEDKTFI